MDKVRTVFEGVLVLGLILFFDITALYLFMKGLCTENWVVPNVIMCSIMELVLCVVIFYHIRRGAMEILRKTRDLEALGALYLRVIYQAFFGILFGLFQLCEALGIFTVPKYDTVPQLVYAINLLLVSSFFFLWMYFSLKEVKRRLRF